MPTRVLLEGPAIEPLLAQVRDEYGSGVRIISADKVRSGGVGGFFAKQHYELSVEVPDPNEDRNDTTSRTAPGDGGHSLERLLEQAESQDRVDDPPRPATPTAGSPRHAETTFSRPAAPPRPAEPPRAAEARPTEEASPDADLSRGAGVRDTSAAFAELMAGLGSNAEPGIERNPPRPAPATPLRGEDTPTVRPFRPTVTTETPVNAPPKATMPAEAPVSTLPPAAMPTVTTEAPMSTPLKAAMPMPTEAPMSTPLKAAMPAPTETPVSVPPKSAMPSLAERIGGLAGDVEIEEDEPIAVPDAELAETAPAPLAWPVKPSTISPAHAAPTPDNEPVVRNLMSVGMPESMARQITGADTYAGVLSVLAARPSAPGIPDGPGEILVLAGDINLGVIIGRHLLDQIGVPENHLLLAAESTAGTGLHSSRLISTREAAEARVDKLHNAEQAWVVVMDAPVGGTDPLWVNEMCDAIGATAVWAVVDATRKTADTARHLRILGEVEALVVHGVEITADPGSVLGLDLPIYSLDGKPATPHVWAAMLCARIATELMPVSAPPRRPARTVRQ